MRRFPATLPAGRLPGIGARSAERLAFYLLKATDAEAFALADAIRDVKTKIHPCKVCFNLTEGELYDAYNLHSKRRGIIEDGNRFDWWEPTDEVFAEVDDWLSA